MNQHLETRKINYLNDSIIAESSEGGINLDEIKNTLIRKFPLIAGLIIVFNSLALLKISITPPVYSAGFELLSEPVNIETKVTSEDDSSRETREQITTVELDQVQLKILQSPQLILRVVKSLQDKYPELSYQELTQGLTIEIISNNKQEQNILLVNYQNSDRDKVSDVINALSKTYLKYSVEKRQSGVKRGIAFLERQIPLVSAQAKEFHEKLRLIRKQNNFIDPNISSKQFAERVGELDQQKQQIQRKLRELRMKSERFQHELNSQTEKSSMATDLATPRYLELSNQLRAIDIEISRKSAIFSDQSAIMQALKLERKELNSLLMKAKADILQKLDDQIAALENSQQSITIETNNLKLRLEKWSKISANYYDLKQKLHVSNTQLNGFLAQKDALEIDAAQQESPWQILTPITEPTTNSVSTLNYLVLSSTLGLFLGSGVALMLDKHQKIIYTSAKVEEITHLPILTTIPFTPQAKQLSLFGNINLPRQERELSSQNQSSSNLELLPVKYSNSSIEVFRSFAVNLGLLNFNQDPSTIFQTNLKSVVITSAIPREGKSTVALNLARASASMGKRVLLVDTDLRSAQRLTTDLGFEAQIGLKDILISSSRYRVMNCIQQLLPEENLFFLTSGIGIEASNFGGKDDSCLLASEQMHNLMARLEEHFDLIIYDLCSINGFADVNLIAAQTDGIVVVTGLGKIQSVALTEALNQLKLSNAPVLGIAVNKVVKKS